jgi:hypothetical protein
MAYTVDEFLKLKLEADEPDGDPPGLPDDIVGDSRRIRLISIDPTTGRDKSMVGEAWQDPDGSLRGTGIAAVMLFEPLSNEKYRQASVAKDVSPLSVLYARLARSSFIRVELVEK